MKIVTTEEIYLEPVSPTVTKKPCSTYWVDPAPMRHLEFLTPRPMMNFFLSTVSVIQSVTVVPVSVPWSVISSYAKSVTRLERCIGRNTGVSICADTSDGCRCSSGHERCNGFAGTCRTVGCSGNLRGGAESEAADGFLRQRLQRMSGTCMCSSTSQKDIENPAEAEAEAHCE